MVGEDEIFIGIVHNQPTAIPFVFHQRFQIFQRPERNEIIVTFRFVFHAVHIQQICFEIGRYEKLTLIFKLCDGFASRWLMSLASFAVQCCFNLSYKVCIPLFTSLHSIK